MTVKVPGVAGPTGKVRILDGAKVIKTVTLDASSSGKATVKLTGLKKGKHKLTAQYLGDADHPDEQVRGGQADGRFLSGRAPAARTSRPGLGPQRQRSRTNFAIRRSGSVRAPSVCP